MVGPGVFRVLQQCKALGTTLNDDFRHVHMGADCVELVIPHTSSRALK